MEIRDTQGRTPFLFAVEMGWIKAMETLVKWGADITTQDLLERNALFFAVKFGHLPICLYLISLPSGQGLSLSSQETRIRENANFHDRQDKFGNTLLHLAMRSKHAHHEMVRFVLELQRDINILNHRGIAPLHLSVVAPPESLVLQEILKDERIEINFRDHTGRTCLHHLVGRNPVHFAKAFQQLLPAGIQLNATDNEGRTALHTAAIEGEPYAALLLLRKSAMRVDIKDMFGLTPLKTLLRQQQQQHFSYFFTMFLKRYALEGRLQGFLDATPDLICQSNWTVLLCVGTRDCLQITIEKLQEWTATAYQDVSTSVALREMKELCEGYSGLIVENYTKGCPADDTYWQHNPQEFEGLYTVEREDFPIHINWSAIKKCQDWVLAVASVMDQASSFRQKLLKGRKDARFKRTKVTFHKGGLPG